MERERRRRGILPGVGGEEEALEGAAQRRSQPVEAALCGGGAAVREVRKGGARGGEEVFLPLYRAEGDGERARKAVGGCARRGSPGLVRGARTRASGHVFERGKSPTRSWGHRELNRGLKAAPLATGERHHGRRRSAHKSHDGDDIGCHGYVRKKGRWLLYLEVKLWQEGPRRRGSRGEDR
jgi:hypothetical protein